jgi:hypothetical protein
MPNEKMIKLAEALASAGYKIDTFKYLHDCDHFYSDVELMLTPLFNTKELLPKDKMMQLVETLASSGYAITKFEFCSQFPPGDIQLILFSLHEKTKLHES